MKTKNILFVEDKDSKYDDVRKVVQDALGSAWSIQRATTLVEAETLLFLKDWHLFILDISMDLVSRKESVNYVNQATLGGLSLARMICIEGLEAPTIVVTGFDTFADKKPVDNDDTIMDLHAVNRSVKESLQDHYFGSVRYGTEGWRNVLVSRLEAVKEWK